MADTRTLKVVVVGNSKGAQGALRSLGVEAQSSGKRMGVLGGGIGKIATRAGIALAGVGAVAAVAGKKVYNLGAPLEQNLGQIQVLGAQTDKQMGNVLKRLQGMSPEFAKMGQNTGDASGAMVELVKAGQTVDQALGSVKATMQLAKAGTMETGDAAALVSNTLNTFGLKAKDSAHMADVLANAANISSADVSDLAFSLSMASNVAAGAGISIEETSGMLAMLANKGMKGSDAGTSLKTMLLSLQAPSKVAAGQLDALGVSMFNAHGKTRPLGKVVEDLSGKLDKMTDKDKASALKKIFGSDAFRAAKVIFGEGAAGLQKYIKGVGKAGGAQDLAEAKTKGFSGAIARLKATSESSAQALYMKLSPALGKGLNKALDSSGKLLAEFGPKLKKAFSGGGSGGMGDQLAKTGQALKTFASGLAPVFSEFGDKFMSTVMPGIKGVANAISKDFLPGLRAILPVIQPVVAFILRMLGSAVIGVIAGVLQALRGAFQIIGGLFRLIAAVIHGDWGKAWQAVKTIFTGAINLVLGALRVWWNMGILSVFRKGITAVLTGVKGLWSGIKGFFTKGVSEAGASLAKLVEVISRPFVRAFEAAKGFITTGWGYIKGAFTGGVGSVGQILGRIIEVITYPYRQAFSLAKAVVSNGWSAIKGFFTSGVGKVMGVLKSFPGKIRSAFGDPLGILKDVGRFIVQGLINGIQAGAGAVAGAVSHLVDLIPGPIKKMLHIASPSKVMVAIGNYVSAGLAKGIREGSEGVGSAVKDITDHLMQLVDDKKISKAKALGVVKIIADQNKALVAKVREREAVAKRLEKARDKLKAVKDNYNNLKESTKGAALSFGSIANVGPDQGRLDAARSDYSSADSDLISALKNQESAASALAKAQGKEEVDPEEVAEAQSELANATSAVTEATNNLATAKKNLTTAEAEEAMTGANINSKLGERLTALQTFNSNIDLLRARGLNEATLQDIIAQGADAGAAMAAALTTSTDTELNQLNATQAQINAQAVTLGTNTADAMYGAGVQSAQGVVAGIVSQLKAVDAAAKRMARRIVRAVRRALGISSPSKVMRNLAGHVGTGFALGIEDGYGDVQAAMNGLGAIRPADSALASAGLAGASSGASGGTVVHLTVQGSVISERDLITKVRKGIAGQQRTAGVPAIA